MANKIVQALETSLNFMVGTEAEPLDQSMIKRIQDVAKLSQREQELITEFLDAFIT
jgi:hypothetical protein